MRDKNSIKQFESMFSKFANDNVADHPEFYQMTNLPSGLWQKMKKRRLFGIGIESEYGGYGADSAAIAISGKALVEHGGNLGIALTWMMHELISRWLITKLGTQRQKNEFLPKLACGDITASFAVSEPDTGAHPKYIKTTVESFKGGFRLNGEKAYLTNGPLADLFIIIAVSGKRSDKKKFSAFLAPKDTKGLCVADPMTLPILRPSPHCGIVLTNFILPSGSAFGPAGKAYETIVKPFREIEDAMLMGPISGGFAFQLSRLKHIFLGRKGKPDEDLVFELGQLQCAADSLFALSIAAAQRMDLNAKNLPVAPLTLYFRNQASTIQERLNRIIENSNAKTDSQVAFLAKDITGALRIASNVAKLKLHAIGETFFTSK